MPPRTQKEPPYSEWHPRPQAVYYLVVVFRYLAPARNTGITMFTSFSVVVSVVDFGCLSGCFSMF
ncbi:hypothetical protein HMPREF0541_01786 [Lacticaseibacillus rhamnosus ATCC 21052]|nr:hypothetical protein HMPREF0541_01786 [Lacticaseibacillus rhamnosus ATCC 21052]